MTAPRSENGAVPDLHASAFADEDACASTRAKNARRILLLGNFGSHNLGNEGSLEAMLVSLGTVPCSTHVIPGDVAKGIVSVATDVGADLIVVGNKRMQGPGRVLGSVPNDVAHTAPCAVLIAKTT